MADERLDNALVDGAPVTVCGEPAKIQRIVIDKLVVVTGRIFGADPDFVERGHKPFRRRVPPGEYPVVLSIVRRENGDERVAFATVHFAEGTPSTWCYASVAVNSVRTR